MLAQLDRIRNRFQNALNESSEARVEAFLCEVPDSDRLALFCLLIPLELACRRRRGESIDFAELNRRFPEYATILESVCKADADSIDGTLMSTIEFVPQAVHLESNETAAGGLSEVGRYRLLQVVGKGGFGEVWKALDPDLDRIVAIKLPRRDRNFTPHQLDAFVAEARRVARLKIAGVVAVYDVGQEGAYRFIVSDFVDGGTLADRMKKGRIPWRESARIVAVVAETLHLAHLQSLVHRDVKPNNILLDRAGRPFVADFGLAVSEAEQLLESSSVVGTYAYMAPEQARGDSNHVDARTDIYSLGVVLYQLLTGRLPFIAQSPRDYQSQILGREARPPRTIDDSIPVELERVCLKCLAKSTTDRYTTAKDLAADLDRWMGRDGGTPRRAWQRIAFWLGTVAVLLALSAGIYKLTVNERTFGLAAPEDGKRSRQTPEAIPTLSADPQSKQILPPPNQPEVVSSAPAASDEMERGWRDELGLSPKELVWPNYKGGGVLGFRPNLQAYEVIAEPVRLIQLGVLEKLPVRLGITVEQHLWSGTVGMFLGYREVDTAQGRAAQMQLISGSRHEMPPGKPVYRVERSIVQIAPHQGYLMTIKDLGYVDLAWPSDSTPLRIELEFDEGRFVSGNWGQSSLPFHVPVHNRRTLAVDYLGPWGVLSHRGTSWFRHPSRQQLESSRP